MDISTLTNLITAFRAETQSNSITPDSLGQLLQKIVYELGEAAEDATVQQLKDWKNLFQNLGSLLTKISLGTDDRNNIILHVECVNPVTLREESSSVTLRQATTERAGIMRAQQVSDLNSVRNKMQHLAALRIEMAATSSAVEFDLVEEYGDVFNSDAVLSVAFPVASASHAGVLTAEDYRKIGSASKAFYTIQCDTRDDKLIVKSTADVINAGYVPYLLRYSKKKPRYSNLREGRKRWYGPIMRGWHLFCDEKKIRVDTDGKVQFGHNVGTDKEPEWEYSEECRWLFGNIRRKYEFDDPTGVLLGYKVGFGCKVHLIDTSHRFRFGIVFGPPLPEGGNRSLDLSQCVTNIAEFYVNFHKTDQPKYEGEYFAISYSI